MKPFALLAVSLLLVGSLLAQDSEPSRAPDGGTHHSVDGIKVLPLPGKPFAGRSTTEWTRTLEDGTVVSTHLLTVVARDSQGRIYRERHKFVPADSTAPSPLQEIRIFDPITHTRTTCGAASHRCIVAGYHAPTSFLLPPVGPFANGTRSIARESLGNDVIDGIDVVGTRETLTINAGVLGNSQPLVITREFWYSPELQVNLSTTRKDPREGTQVVRVSDVSTAEPDAALFKIPSGFVLEGADPAKPSN